MIKVCLCGRFEIYPGLHLTVHRAFGNKESLHLKDALSNTYFPKFREGKVYGKHHDFHGVQFLYVVSIVHCFSFIQQ